MEQLFLVNLPTVNGMPLIDLLDFYANAGVNIADSHWANSFW